MGCEKLACLDEEYCATCPREGHTLSASELPFQSHPVAIDVGNGDWRRVVSAHNVVTQTPKTPKWTDLASETHVYVEGFKFPFTIPSALRLVVSHV